MAATDERTKNRNFLLLLYVATLTTGTLYAPQPLLSSIQTSYPSLSNSTVALITAVTILPLGLAPLVYGFYLRAMNTRLVLFTAVLLLDLAGIALFFCTNFWSMVGLRLLQGLIIPAMMTCMMAIISSKFYGQELQRALAIYIGMTVLGGVIGRLGAGMLATCFGWRYTFLGCSLALTLALVPLWRLPDRGGNQNISHVSFSDFFVIWRSPGMAELLSIEAFVLFLYAAIANYLPFRLTELGQGINEWRIALLYTGNLIGVFMAFASRWIIQKMGSETSAIALGLGIILMGMPALMCGDLLTIFATMCVISVGQFLIHSICPGLINRLKAGDKGAVNGVYLSAYYTGGAIGAYGPGFIYTYFGWDVFIGALMLIILIASTISIVSLRRHMPTDTE